MSRTVRISGSVEGVIPTGSYNNLRPSFAWEEEISDCTMSDAEIQERRKQLYEMSFALLKQAEDRAKAERIERESEELRLVANPATGRISPSVTSVINEEIPINPEDLRQYASAGNCTHGRVRHYIETGKWVDAKDIKSLWIDILVVSRGSLGLSCNAGNFPAFLNRYRIIHMRNMGRLFDKDDLYNGEPDFIGIPHFKKGSEPVATVFDVKRTPDKIKNGIQLSAYCRLTGYKQGVIVPLNDKTEQGFSRPVVYDKKTLDGYYGIFLEKRKEFKKRFGL